MLRTLLYTLLGIIGITFLKMVIGIIGKVFREAAGESARPSAASASSGSAKVPKGTELRKCAVCGTYSPAAGAPKVSGVDAFVCSDACAVKFRT
jgi:hypothetical protein